MFLEIRKNTNKEQWDNFLSQFYNFNPFPQSFAWGNILELEKKEIERLAIFENNEIIAMITVVYEKLPIGFKYAFSPKGPVFSEKLEVESYKVIMDEFIKYLKDKGCIFWRIEPNINLKSEIKNHKLVQIKDINPSNTLLLDLEKSIEEIYSDMHSKTRYNIGLSKKKDLQVEEKKDLEVFWELIKKTGERDNFRLHYKKHYEEVLKSELSTQVIIYNQEKPIATGVFIKFGQVFTYLYGAFDYEFRQTMAPYLVQDFGINKAKNERYRYYDFFGIAPIKKIEGGEWTYNNKHQYAGVTRFKLGFGGQYYFTTGTFEVVLNYKLYKVYNIVKFLRSLFKK